MTTSTLTVAEFVTARLDEDEAAARAAEASDAWGNPYSDGTDLCYTFTPERVLAQCAAMRRIVEVHHPHDHGGEHGDAMFCDECQWDHVDDSPRIDNQPVEGFGDHPCQTLAALASIWSDHPSWREEWR